MEWRKDERWRDESIEVRELGMGMRVWVLI